MIVGAHLRNEPTLLGADRARWRLAEFSGAIVMPYHDPIALLEFGVTPADSLVRLPDSVQDGIIVSHQEYARQCADVVRRFTPHGFRRFILDNEPDWSWAPSGQSAWGWATFMADALRDLKPVVDALDAELVFTPLSVHADKSLWYDAALGKGVITACKAVACHCYWQAPGDITADWAGYSFRWWQQATGLPVYITEAGNSICQAPAPPPLETIRYIQATQYPTYLLLTRRKKVAGVYFFILGQNGDWEGFDLSDKTCYNIARSRHTLVGGGGGKLT